MTRSQGRWIFWRITKNEYPAGNRTPQAQDRGDAGRIKAPGTLRRRRTRPRRAGNLTGPPFPQPPEMRQARRPHPAGKRGQKTRGRAVKIPGAAVELVAHIRPDLAAGKRPAFLQAVPADRDPCGGPSGGRISFCVPKRNPGKKKHQRKPIPRRFPLESFPDGQGGSAPIGSPCGGRGTRDGDERRREWTS